MESLDDVLARIDLVSKITARDVPSALCSDLYGLGLVVKRGATLYEWDRVELLLLADNALREIVSRLESFNVDASKSI